jgi:transketolase
MSTTETQQTATTTQPDANAALRDVATRLRIHSIRSTTEAGSGHPTTCCSAADIVATLFFGVMKFDPRMPENPANDRCIFSKGHAAPLLYAAWAEAGAFPVEDLLKLRKIDSDLEGHPTPRLPFVDVATGSLGQGLGVGVGVALAAKLDKLDYTTFVLLGDGECAEGSVWEAVAMASHYKLDNLIAIVDVNRLGQSQATMLEHDLETYKKRFAAFGWKVITCDGHNFDELHDAFGKARRAKEQPAVILAKTIKGKGIAIAEDKNGFHGVPLKKGEEADKAIADLKAQLTGAPTPKISKRRVPPPQDAPNRVALAAPTYSLGDKVATREAYGAALAKIAADPRTVALDGDTKNSTFSNKFLAVAPERFFECFIAEQNMVAAAVGLSSRGKIAFASTFACFLARAYDHIRMAGISKSNIKLCGSHAGVSIGEDGPSQMALEDLAMMRAIHGCTVLYPCDAVSAERCVELAANTKGMFFIRTSRPKTPVIYGNDETFKIGGSKILRSSVQDKATVVGCGVTVFEALKAHDQLKAQGVNVRVIDAYSIKPIDRQTLLASAKDTNNTIITVEDHYPEGGLGDAVAAALAPEGVKVHKLAVTDLPRSGTPDELMDKYGISARRIVELVKSKI